MLHSNHGLHQPIHLSNHLILVPTILISNALEYRPRLARCPLDIQDLIKQLELCDDGQFLNRKHLSWLQ